MRPQFRGLAATALVAVLGAGLGGVLVAPAGAAPQDASDAPSRLTWAVQPATAKGLDTRPNFTRAVSPGQRVVDHVAVSNFSRKPLTFDLYAADAFNTDKGEFSLAPKATQAEDAGAWVELKKSKLTVPARSKTIVPVSIDVPRNAQPGDHTGGIVASLTTGAEAASGTSGKVAVEQRVGTRLYLRVIGEVRSALTVTDVSLAYDAPSNPVAGGTATVTYTVDNPGNTRMSGPVEVEVAGPFGAGRRVAAATQLPELLPGERVTYSAEVDGVRPLGRLTATVTIQPVPLPATEGTTGLEPVVGSATLWAFPWAGLGVLLLLVAVAAALLLRRRSVRTGGTGGTGAPTEAGTFARTGS